MGEMIILQEGEVESESSFLEGFCKSMRNEAIQSLLDSKTMPARDREAGQKQFKRIENLGSETGKKSVLSHKEKRNGARFARFFSSKARARPSAARKILKNHFSEK